jgi:drug/metabolite transporter (DMT)-like permease
LWHEDPVSRWRRLAIANTVAGVIVVVAAWVFVPTLIAALLVALMVLGVGNTWLLDRRLRRTGNMFRVRKRQ